MINRTDDTVTYIEIGDRPAGGEVDYPRDNLKAEQAADGSGVPTHKDGTPY